MPKRSNNVFTFDEFKKSKLKQKDEISPISEEPEDEKLIDSPDVVELENDTNKKRDYYDVKQDFIAPKPFRKKS